MTSDFFFLLCWQQTLLWSMNEILFMFQQKRQLDRTQPIILHSDKDTLLALSKRIAEKFSSTSLEIYNLVTLLVIELSLKSCSYTSSNNILVYRSLFSSEKFIFLLYNHPKSTFLSLHCSYKAFSFISLFCVTWAHLQRWTPYSGWEGNWHCHSSYCTKK